ncbi:MAG: DUF2298 domain-containing protein [Patescibacteria group bacterium]
MDWLFPTFSWYFLVFILGLLFFPLTKRLFSSFIDKGYAFSKTIAILLLSYIVFVFGSLKIPVFNISFISSAAAVILFISLIFLTSWAKRSSSWPKRIIVFEEALFIVSFIFLAFIRGQRPDIHGLEKFMDFGIINSILRSNYFPPLDMWLSSDSTNLSGYAVNYYYFGHLWSALLIKLSGIKASIGYNLSLATIFGLSMTSVFSICLNLIYLFKKNVLKLKKIKLFTLALYGLLGALIVNLGGNLHTIYLFTSGYPNESPIPFWQILSTFTPEKYWYPNATRFIPFTIHEFPSYSFTVADLHGHVLDIPFVLLTISLFFLIYSALKKSENIKNYILYFIFAGFMIAILYMTNAFDGLIYFILAACIYLTIYGVSKKFLFSLLITGFSAMLISYPFISNFSSFVSKIGINCPSASLSNIKNFGPFIFEAGNCQPSPAWMLFILWGFFITSFIIFIFIKLRDKKQGGLINTNKIDNYALLLMLISTIFILIPEFFYVKDIYPVHFRANTMFKLGYQVFIMMGIASTYVFFRVSLIKKRKALFKAIFIFLLFFVLIYPFFSFSSYYHPITKEVELDGSLWLKKDMSEDFEIINYLNKNIKDQPVILEAQGDSYTDFARISSYTGLPTVAGWWVHEWLWRGSPDIVGKRIPDIEKIYESDDINSTLLLLKKYKVKYIVVSGLEKKKYKNLNEEKFNSLGTKIFETSNKIGAVYKAK